MCPTSLHPKQMTFPSSVRLLRRGVVGQSLFKCPTWLHPKQIGCPSGVHFGSRLFHPWRCCMFPGFHPCCGGCPAGFGAIAPINPSIIFSSRSSLSSFTGGICLPNIPIAQSSWRALDVISWYLLTSLRNSSHEAGFRLHSFSVRLGFNPLHMWLSFAASGILGSTFLQRSSMS